MSKDTDDIAMVIKEAAKADMAERAARIREALKAANSVERHHVQNKMAEALKPYLETVVQQHNRMVAQHHEQYVRHKMPDKGIIRRIKVKNQHGVTESTETFHVSMGDAIEIKKKPQDLYRRHNMVSPVESFFHPDRLHHVVGVGISAKPKQLTHYGPDQTGDDVCADAGPQPFRPWTIT